MLKNIAALWRNGALTWYACIGATHVTSDEKALLKEWDQILRKEGLGMSRGRMGGKLSYVTPRQIEKMAEVVEKVDE